MKIAVSLLACLFASVAFAAPPPAPAIDVHASNIKQLEFNWTPVTQVNRYELWFKANDGAAWVKYAETPAQRPRFRIGVSVHLLDWRQARYYVKACNPSGCSSSNQVGVDGEALAAMGFVKPSTAGERKFFGIALGLSADGNTMAVLASDTAGAIDGVATVYVYRKSSSGWAREARLHPSVLQRGTTGNFYGDNLAISGDGNVIALGLWNENVNGVEMSGAVYLFRRSGSSWRQSQRLIGANVIDDQYGFMVELDDAGRTLVVSHQYPSGTYEPGALEVFTDPLDSSDDFEHQATVRANGSGGSQGWCEGIALSGDGNTLLRTCQLGNNYTQVLLAPQWIQSAVVTGGTADGVDINYDGTLMLVQDGMGAKAWRRESTGWVDDGTLPNTAAIPYFARRHLALSRDGKIAALGNFQDYTIGRGPLYPPYVSYSDPNRLSGAVMVYERKASGWVVRRLVKPDSVTEGNAGHAVALGDNGKTLAVGAPTDWSSARGFDGDRDDSSSVFRGAVWLY
jgi:hypothetical protein